MRGGQLDVRPATRYHICLRQSREGRSASGESPYRQRQHYVGKAMTPYYLTIGAFLLGVTLGVLIMAVVKISAIEDAYLKGWKAGARYGAKEWNGYPGEQK